MCGIAGFLNFSQKHINLNLICDMVKKMRHRGPDDDGFWINDSIALGHTRLSIHDVSYAAHQPMFSFNKHWIIVFNGEIYNFVELKSRILREQNIVFKSNADTEVLINAISLWGISKTLQSCIGMFAFAAYHISEKKLYLARDRFGEKPLYYGIQNGILGFSSELKALKPLRSFDWKFDIDRDVLASYLRFGYVSTPYSIYKNIYKLAPGSYFEIDFYGNQKNQFYWQTKNILSQPKFLGSYEDAVFVLEEKLKDALRLQMAADVPLGAFLSGGIDSSAIVALMQEISLTKINTFCAGFQEKPYNETKYAKTVSNYIGTNHTEIIINKNDALNIIPKLPHIYDEPFADSSQIACYFVSKIAKKYVSVALSGDGGDELFGGYNRYLLANKIKTMILDRPVINNLIAGIPFYLLKLLSSFSLLPEKIMKLQSIVSHAKNSQFDLYIKMCSQFYKKNFVLGGSEISFLNEKISEGMHELSYQEWMMYADSKTYMIDDILVKMDRASMVNSLETRVPFLDHRLYEFAWSLPISYKIRNGVSKSILRDVLYKYVPKKLIDRPKMGFGIPLGSWLSQDLRPWVENSFDKKRMLQEGYFDVAIVQQYWKEHLSGKKDNKAILWNILMFQSWLQEHNKD